MFAERTRIEKGPSRAAVLLAALMMSAGCAASSHAVEGPAEGADEHVAAIALSSVDGLMAAYAADARLEWIGGPLDGAYQGKDEIAGAWRRFAAARGAMSVDVAAYDVAENPKGRTVIASVLYDNGKAIPVRLITSYRGGLIVSEIWQIDPGIAD